jgi:hypothetical protein
MVYQICISMKVWRGQLDRTSSKNFPSINADIDLILEKQREPIVGHVIEDVFVLPSEFQAKSTSDQVEGENERPITIDDVILVRSSNLVDPEESCNTMVNTNAEFSGDSTNDQVQSAINEGRLEFAENPQMKLDEDLLQVNMNTVKLEGKKVLVQPSQAESTKGRKVIIGGERQSRMIRPKNPKIGRWKKHERSKPRSHPKATFDILMAKYRDSKAGIRGRKNWTIRFAWIRYFCGRKLIQQPIQGTTMAKFRRSGSSLTGVSSGTLLPNWAINA